jgi:hypothetical protein
LVALDYWTCDRNNNGQQWPFLMLNVDWNGDQQPDDIIFFEPSYQNPAEGGACGTMSGQPTPVLKTWQHWDALKGSNGANANACWWSLNELWPGRVRQGFTATVGGNDHDSVAWRERRRRIPPVAP